MTISLRPFRQDDQEFIFKLYVSTRLGEIAELGWSEAQKETFLRMQFEARYRSYESTYGKAEHHIVEQNGRPIGRVMVLWERDFVLLVDIALLGEYRQQGIGGRLVRELIEQCNRRSVPLRLQVSKTNPALRLYERLGFIRQAEDQMYIQMEHRPEFLPLS
jgi:ribosomal protein S18 acetylase RimI-like enzyme